MSKLQSLALQSIVPFFGVVVAIGCGGSSTSDNNAGGSGGSGATSSGGTSSGGTSSGGTSSGGTSSGGSAGSGGGAAGANQCGGPGSKGCTEPSDCVLATDNCCLCGVPEITDYQAINSQFTGQCTCTGPACGCASAENPNLAATCNTGSCEGFDVRQVDAYSGCTTETDCSLRLGIGCCEACTGGEYNLIAVKSDQSALTQALCGSAGANCPDCAPQYPANKKAACVDNHCQVVDQ